MMRAKGVAPDHVRDQLAAASDFESLTGPLRFKDGRARRRVFVVGLHDGEAKIVQTHRSGDGRAGGGRPLTGFVPCGRWTLRPAVDRLDEA